MRRFWGRFSWLPVLLVLGGFVWFVVWISEPLREAERKSLVTGSIHAADPLKPDGPFIPYVALHRGHPSAGIPEFPLDDRQPDGDGRFELSADASDGTRFFLLARFETAKQERYCRTLALPELRRTEDGEWVDAATGRRLPAQRITVDKSTRCD